MSEPGEKDWMAPEEILLKIAAHLQSAVFGLGHPYSGRSRAHVERAQDVLEEMLGTLPPGDSPPSKKPLDHLEEADALAKEHLGMSGAELDLSEAVAEAARQAGAVLRVLSQRWCRRSTLAERLLFSSRHQPMAT